MVRWENQINPCQEVVCCMHERLQLTQFSLTLTLPLTESDGWKEFVQTGGRSGSPDAKRNAENAEDAGVHDRRRAAGP